MCTNLTLVMGRGYTVGFGGLLSFSFTVWQKLFCPTPPPPPPPTPQHPTDRKLLAPHYCSTWPRVSGSLRARKLPAASAPEAKRMGTALVIPTNEVKMLIPKTAANLQSALRNPNAVVLRKEGADKEQSEDQSQSKRKSRREKQQQKWSFTLFLKTALLIRR